MSLFRFFEALHLYFFCFHLETVIYFCTNFGKKNLNIIVIRAWTPTCMTSYALSCSVFSFKARKLFMITYDL